MRITTAVEDRFTAHTTPLPDAPGCWLWTGSRSRSGYGRFQRGRVDGMVTASRFAYQLAYGAIPPGLNVLHHCDTPACVRPDHLYLGTQADTVRDMVVRGRHGTANRMVCVNGHPFTPENTYQNPRGYYGHRPYRACRECHRQLAKLRRERTQ